jgi:Tol biopolymer transport system component
MKADGSNPLLFGPGGHVSWAPDSEAVVYDMEVAEGDVDLYLTELAESQDMLLVDGPGIESTPAWSPDGDMVDFAPDRSQ